MANPVPEGNLVPYSEEEAFIRRFRTYLKNLDLDLRSDFENDVLVELLARKRDINRSFKVRRKQETYTQDRFVVGMFDVLGYGKAIPQPMSDCDEHAPDFDLMDWEGHRILVECKPYGYKLDGGITEMKRYLVSGMFGAVTGIVTDGMVWVLVRMNPHTGGVRVDEPVDLNRYLLDAHDRRRIGMDDTIRRFWTTFSNTGIARLHQSMRIAPNTDDEPVDRVFRKAYRMFVLGHGTKVGGLTRSMLTMYEKGIVDEDIARPHAVQLVNRLILFRFIEAKGLMPMGPIERTYVSFIHEHPRDPYHTDCLLPRLRAMSEEYGTTAFDIPRRNVYFRNDAMDRVVNDFLGNLTFTIEPDNLTVDVDSVIRAIPGILEDMGSSPDPYADVPATEAVSRYVLDRLQGAVGIHDRCYPTVEVLVRNMSRSKVLEGMLHELDGICILDANRGCCVEIVECVDLFVKIRVGLSGMDPYEAFRQTLDRNVRVLGTDAVTDEMVRLALWLAAVRHLPRGKRLPNLDDVFLSPGSKGTFDMVLGAWDHMRKVAEQGVLCRTLPRDFAYLRCHSEERTEIVDHLKFILTPEGHRDCIFVGLGHHGHVEHYQVYKGFLDSVLDVKMCRRTDTLVLDPYADDLAVADKILASKKTVSKLEPGMYEEFLSCLMKSRLMGWYAEHFLGMRLEDLDEKAIGALPFPRKKVNAGLFARLLTENPSGKGSEIDAAIYKVYGLNGRDVNTVENGPNPILVRGWPFHLIPD